MITPQTLPKQLQECQTEEEVKNLFARAFKFKLDTRRRMDLYTPRILFEFKYKRNFSKASSRASVVAQSLYYVRALKYGNNADPVPPIICFVDTNEAFFVETNNFKKLLDSSMSTYDWDRAPSTPCPKLVEALEKTQEIHAIHVHNFDHKSDFDDFCRILDGYRHEQQAFNFSSNTKKVITESTFQAAYSSWCTAFEDYVENGRKSSEYFLLDLQENRTELNKDRGEILFKFSESEVVTKPIPVSEYEHFWSLYEKVMDPRAVQGIRQRMDRLTVEDFRRKTGEFFTPIEFAKKAIDYIERVVGPKWWEKGYRLWDMAAGTGNLEFELPEEALPYTYMSTLLADDAQYCANLFPTATVFQYDFLNDDVMERLGGEMSVEPIKLPKKLHEELLNPSIKWIIFINPPFATANVAQDDIGGDKTGVSMTAVRQVMATEGLGETSRELFVQFLWRISKEFTNRNAILGLFSPPKYVNANNDQRFRDQIFQFTFKTGFCFPSKAFDGNKGDFPVGFLIWDLADRKPLNEQHIRLDVFNIAAEKIGFKDFPSVHRENFLNKLPERPPTKSVFPPFSSAITIPDGKKDVRDRVADGFLASLMTNGNDFAHQNNTAIFSGPYVSAGAFSIVPSNFETAMFVHAARLVRKMFWLNSGDQFYRPTQEIPSDLIHKAVVWGLFARSNQTVSLRAAKYKGQVFEVRNNFYPFSWEQVSDWKPTSLLLESSLQRDRTSRFVSDYLSQVVLPDSANKLLEAAAQIYSLLYAKSSMLPLARYKVENWDLGWYQVRKLLSDEGLGLDLFEILSNLHRVLGKEIEATLEPLGVLLGHQELFSEEL